MIAPDDAKCEGTDLSNVAPDAGKEAPTWQTGIMKSLYENLSEPAPLEKGALRVIPLGGLGEVGRNMDVLEYRGKLLVVDCGVLFPEETQPGVDLILPDFSWIEDRMDDVVGLVLTHGHEDHIGAVPYLLKLRGDIPIYGSDLTLAFVAPKLREHRLSDPGLNVVAEGDRLTVGPFDLVRHPLDPRRARGFRAHGCRQRPHHG